MIFNKRIAKVILLAPKGGIVILGRNNIRWEPRTLSPSRRAGVAVYIDNVKIGVYAIKCIREFAKA